MGKGLEDIWGGGQLKTLELELAERQAHEAAQSARVAAAAGIRAEILEKRRQILAGEESTGSQLEDGLIVLYGANLNKIIVEKYKSIDAALKQTGVGEPVVAIRRRIQSSGCTGFGGRLHYHLDRIIAMGILNGQVIQFDYENLKASLPTSKYKYDYWSFHKEMEAQDGGIVIESTGNDYLHHKQGFQIDYLDTPIKPLPGESVELPAFELQPVLDTEIIVGRERLKNWLAAPTDNLALDHYFNSIRKLSIDLGISPIEPATDWQKMKVQRSRHY